MQVTSIAQIKKIAKDEHCCFPQTPFIKNWMKAQKLVFGEWYEEDFLAMINAGDEAYAASNPSE